MSRSRIAFFLVSALLVFPMLAGTLLRAADKQQTPEDDSFYKYLAVFSEALGLVRQAYVDDPDMDLLMSGALDGTTDALDPFSIYVPAEHVAGYMEARAVGRRHSGLTLLKERGIAYVVAVEKGSPASEAGVKAGDIVSEMDGRSTRLMPLWEIQEILAKKAGTKVSMELIRLGEPVQASFTLKPFDPPAPSVEEVEGGVMMLRIPTFDDKTAEGVREALRKGAQRAAGKLLIDLRGVSSGEPDVAFDTAELFTSGDLGSLKRRAEELETYKAAGEPVWKGKLVVLVDRGTLGASEVFATVLRQKEKAELVGERTFGYAGRQNTAQLSTGGRLLYTDAFYTGPDRQPINDGLRPDLLVDERSRNYLEKDVPISDLILKRGIGRLLGQTETTSEAKAA
ncbi:MAG TPA: S41 family peptidase [Thermoanaerobaculia bacterium]|nr:S41 family peptidase [Thermoanaerobaculia bacterium]